MGIQGGEATSYIDQEPGGDDKSLYLSSDTILATNHFV